MLLNPHLLLNSDACPKNIIAKKPKAEFEERVRGKLSAYKFLE